jgi:hypothetical protein
MDFHAWNRLLLGRYRVRSGIVELDFVRMVQDKKVAAMVQVHEALHRTMSQVTDFGQTTRLAFYVYQNYKHLSVDQGLELAKQLFEAQIFVQEGVATYAQIAHLASLTSKKESLKWADDNLPKDYLDRFNKFRFIFDLPDELSNPFIQLGICSLETDIRTALYQKDLFRSPEALKSYLDQGDINPDIRMTRILGTIRANPAILKKSLKEIIQTSGLTVYRAANKEEVAQSVNYVAELTGEDFRLDPNQVGDSKGPALALKEALENAQVVNLNLDLTEHAEPIIHRDDFLHYADVASLLFVTPMNDSLASVQGAEVVLGYKPEIGLLMLTNKNEKYITYRNRKDAEKIIGKEMSKVPVMVESQNYDFKDREAEGFSLKPSIVMCPTIDEFRRFISEQKELKEEVKISSVLPEEGARVHLVIARPKSTDTFTVFVSVAPALVSSAVGELSNVKSFDPKELEAHQDILNPVTHLLGVPPDIKFLDGVEKLEG